MYMYITVCLCMNVACFYTIVHSVKGQRASQGRRLQNYVVSMAYKKGVRVAFDT